MDMEYLTTKILTQYPDIGQITKLYSELRKRGESAVFVLHIAIQRYSPTLYF